MKEIIREDGSSISEILEIRDGSINFFKNLIAVEHESNQEAANFLLQNISAFVQENQNSFLISPVKNLEIKSIVFEMAGKRF